MLISHSDKKDLLHVSLVWGTGSQENTCIWEEITVSGKYLSGMVMFYFGKSV